MAGWQAPEVEDDDDGPRGVQAPATDVYSAGLTLACLALGQPAFYEIMDQLDHPIDKVAELVSDLEDWAETRYVGTADSGGVDELRRAQALVEMVEQMTRYWPHERLTPAGMLLVAAGAVIRHAGGRDGRGAIAGTGT